MEDQTYHTIIKELPQDERPRERLIHHGAEALSNAELTAIALRTGSRKHNALQLAHELLSRFGGLGGMARASVSELCEVPGIGQAKAAQIHAAIELGKRLILADASRRDQIRNPGDAAIIFQARLRTEVQEQMMVMLLDTQHRVMRLETVYVGNVNASMIRVAEIFREAIKQNATAIIVAHNHPSGDTTPSSDDVRVTQEIARAGKMLDINVLDHIIVGGNSFCSLKQEGKGFS